MNATLSLFVDQWRHSEKLFENLFVSGKGCSISDLVALIEGQDADGG